MDNVEYQIERPATKMRKNITLTKNQLIEAIKDCPGESIITILCKYDLNDPTYYDLISKLNPVNFCVPPISADKDVDDNN